MRNYPEWSHLEKINDSKNPFSTLYKYDDGSMFYVEPVFYTQLEEFGKHHEYSVALILEEMEKIVRKNRLVVFTGEFDSPLTKNEDAIYLEIFDITDKLQIFVEDKSRGSDYGD